MGARWEYTCTLTDWEQAFVCFFLSLKDIVAL